MVACAACGCDIRLTLAEKAKREKRGQRLFCSAECRDKAQRGLGSLVNVTVEVECVQCGLRFRKKRGYLKRPGRNFCSRRCVIQGQRGKGSHNYKNKVELTCVTCGNTFFVIPSREDNARFCSKHCKNWSPARPRGDKHHAWKGGVTPERVAHSRSKEWKSAVAQIWVRADRRCERCKRKWNRRTKTKFHIHHRISFQSVENRSKPDNLVLLCAPCHYFVHSGKNVSDEFLGKYQRTFISGLNGSGSPKALRCH